MDEGVRSFDKGPRWPCKNRLVWKERHDWVDTLDKYGRVVYAISSMEHQSRILPAQELAQCWGTGLDIAIGHCDWIIGDRFGHCDLIIAIATETLRVTTQRGIIFVTSLVCSHFAFGHCNLIWGIMFIQIQGRRPLDVIFRYKNDHRMIYGRMTEGRTGPRFGYQKKDIWSQRDRKHAERNGELNWQGTALDGGNGSFYWTRTEWRRRYIIWFVPLSGTTILWLCWRYWMYGSDDWIGSRRLYSGKIW
jgi:hypothetical protein